MFSLKIQWYIRVFMFLVLGLWAGTPNFAHAQDVKTLKNTLSAAYQNNPGLMARRAELRAADEAVAIALSGYRPRLTANAETGRRYYETQGQNSYSGQQNLSPNSVQLELTQPLFSGFKTSSLVAAAKADVFAKRASLENEEQQLLYDAASAYFDLLEAQKNLALIIENEKVLKEQLEITIDRFRVGELKKTDVSQAEARYMAASVSRTEANNALNNQKKTFYRIVGVNPHEILEDKEIKIKSPKNFERFIDEAASKNPSAVYARYQLTKSKEDISATSADFWPQLNLVGSAGRSWDQSLTMKERQDSAAAILRLTIPLYNGGETYARTRAAQQTSVQKRLELDDILRRIRERAQTSWNNYKTSQQTISGRKEVVKAAREALIGVEEESKVGSRTVLDVLNARQELLDAQINLVKAKHDASLAALQVYAALGKLTARHLKLKTKLYDPDVNYNKARNSWFGFVDDEEP